RARAGRPSTTTPTSTGAAAVPLLASERCLHACASADFARLVAPRWRGCRRSEYTLPPGAQVLEADAVYRPVAAPAAPAVPPPAVVPPVQQPLQQPAAAAASAAEIPPQMLIDQVLSAAQAATSVEQMLQHTTLARQ